MARIVLASASPRRAELLEKIELEFEVMPSNTEEIIDEKDLPKAVVKKLSTEKARDVADRLSGCSEDTLVIGADTIVVADRILGKPSSKEDAFNMLSMLEGKSHKVITGVTVIDVKSGKTVSEAVETLVYMRKLSTDEINAYISTGEPMDKAGSYGIQGIGSLLIEKIEGCYFNVVGLPLSTLAKMLNIFNIRLL
jgi:MAF protein